MKSGADVAERVTCAGSWWAPRLPDGEVTDVGEGSKHVLLRRSSCFLSNSCRCGHNRLRNLSRLRAQLAGTYEGEV